MYSAQSACLNSRRNDVGNRGNLVGRSFNELYPTHYINWKGGNGMAIDLTKLRSRENKGSGYIGWIPGSDYMNGMGDFDSNMVYNTWSEFYDAWGYNDTELNTVVNYYFAESARDEDDNIIEVELNLWILHPRKGASRAVTIKFIKEDELPAVKQYLSKQFEQVKKWFAWL